MYKEISINNRRYDILVTYNEKFADCYSIYIEYVEEDRKEDQPEVLSMSKNPSHPQGVFSAISGTSYNADDNTRNKDERIIGYQELPEKCKEMLIGWLEDY